MKYDNLAKAFYFLIGSTYKKAHKYYLEMLDSVEKEPIARFKLNILDACLVGSVYFAIDKKVTCEQMYQMNKYVIYNNFFYKID